MTVNSVSEVIVPEYNDAFIAEVTDYASIKEFEEATMEELMLNAQEESESNAGSDALQKAVEQASIDGYPQALYDACYNSTIEEYQEYAEMFDMDLSEFMGDEDEMEAEVLNWVNEILVSQAIAEKEGFTVTDENFNDDAEELALDYGYDSLEEFTEDYGETYVRLNLIKERAIDFCMNMQICRKCPGKSITEKTKIWKVLWIRKYYLRKIWNNSCKRDKM